MSGRGRGSAWLGVLSTVLLVSGCAVQRIENGVYHSPKGYRLAVPAAPWTPVNEGPADLELRHRVEPARMAVSAVCEGRAPRRATGVLARQLLIGLRDRTVIERGTMEVAGHPADRVVLDGRLEDTKERVRIETVVMNNERCVYDFMYVAPAGVFEALRLDFARLVDGFRTE
jgi:hypothetical protein